MGRLGLCHAEYQQRGVNQGFWVLDVPKSCCIENLQKWLKINRNFTIICLAITTMDHWCICPWWWLRISSRLGLGESKIFEIIGNGVVRVQVWLS